MRARVTIRLGCAAVIAAALIAPLAVTAQTPHAPHASPERWAATIDSLTQDAIDRGDAVGVAVLVMRGDDTVRAAGYGLADAAAARPVTPHSVFRIGSLTKQFTAAAIMRLVEQGRINLDDPLTRHLPDYPMQGRTVTVRQLLNHTSGIRSYTGMPAWGMRMALPFTPDSLIAIFAAAPFDFEPGTAYRYNNSGYVLLGRIIERLTGESYAAHIERELIPRAGLQDTRYCPDVPAGPADAKGYGRAGAPPTPARSLSMTSPYAAGALCSTVFDLARWQDALTSGRVVTAASYAAMTSPDTLADGTRMAYGFGLGTGRDGAHRVVSHNGGINGFVSSLTWLPDDSVTIAILVNTESSAADQLDAQFRRVVTGRPLIVPPAEITLSTAQRAVYVGTYALALPTGATLPLRVFEQDGRLMAQAPNQPAFPIVASGEHRFAAAGSASIRLTFTVADGRASTVALEQGGRTAVGARIP